jgi:ABC-2 type transport system permease protein
MHYLKLLTSFFKRDTQAEMAYSTHFFIRLLHTILNLVTGVISLQVIYHQVDTLNGWTLSSALGLLGVYLTLSALRGLFIGPSLESVAGMDGEIWQGTFDFTLLRPINKQFLVSFNHWEVFALLDLGLALGVLGIAVSQMGETLSLMQIISFLVALLAGIILFYAVMLAFTSLIFWQSGFLFTWVFNDLFQLARFPVSLYPGWLRLILTWIIPVGLMTTVPAEALAGQLSVWEALGVLGVSLAALAGASFLFKCGLRKYSSASS